MLFRSAEKIRTLATSFHFLSEAIAVEKSHSISAANFGALKNTSGKSFKPAAPKPEETEQAETEQTGTEQTETEQTGTERARTEISAAARTAKENNA